MIFGATVEDNFIFDEGANICRFRSECVSIGLGFFLGAGVTAPLGMSMSDIEKSLAGTSVGLSYDIGACLLATGKSITAGYDKEGITSIGSAKGFSRLGFGCGLAITLDLCEAEVRWCNKP